MSALSTLVFLVILLAVPVLIFAEWFDRTNSEKQERNAREFQRGRDEGDGS